MGDPLAARAGGHGRGLRGAVPDVHVGGNRDTWAKWPTDVPQLASLAAKCDGKHARKEWVTDQNEMEWTMQAVYPKE